MRISICITLLLTFVIFPNSVLSINPAARRNPLLGPPQPGQSPRRGYYDNEVLYAYVDRTVGRPQEIVKGRPESEPNPDFPQAESSQKPKGRLNDGALIMYRDTKPIGRVQGRAIYEIHPLQNGQSKIVLPKNGDIVIYGGIPIAKYENGWRRFYQPQTKD